jgi:hypothetical protein
MAEFAIVLKHKRHWDQEKNLTKLVRPETTTKSKVGPLPDLKDVRSHLKKRLNMLKDIKKRVKDPQQFAHVVDMYSSILFGISFLLFNIIYCAHHA